MKTLKISAIFFFLFVLSGSAFPQSVQVGVEIGATVPQADLGGSVFDFYNGTKYGANSGMNFGLTGKFGIPLFTIRAGVGYLSLSNGASGITGGPGSRIDTKNHILSFSAGPEFYFPVVGSPIKPYLGVNLILSSIGGEASFQGVSNVPSGTYTVSSASRFGIGFAAGSEIRLSSVTLDLGLRYNMYNLIGKDFVALPSDNRIDSYVNVNDARDPQYNASTDHFIANDRNISTFQFNLGVLFGLY